MVGVATVLSVCYVITDPVTMVMYEPLPSAPVHSTMYDGDQERTEAGKPLCQGHCHFQTHLCKSLEAIPYNYTRTQLYSSSKLGCTS